MGATVQRLTIPYGDAGSLATVARMRVLINSAIRNPLVVESAHDIALTAPIRDNVRIAIAIRDWLARNFAFVRDPVAVELIRTPEYMLRQLQVRRVISGDCDDAAVLGCALGKAVGIQCKLVTVGFERSPLLNPSPLAHVFGVLLPHGWKRIGGTEDQPTVIDAEIPVSLDVTKPARSVAQVRRRLEFAV